MTLRIDIRDHRLPDGRLNIAARTDSKKERARRKRALLVLLDQGNLGAIELLKRRKLHITEVVNAVESGDFSEIDKATAHLRSDSLGNAIAKLVRIKQSSRKPRTYVVYKNWLKVLEEHFGSSANLETITREQAEDWLHSPKAQGRVWSPRTQRAVRILCSTVWKRAGAKNNPWLTVELSKVRTHRSAFLQPQEWRDLINAIRGTPDAAIMALGCLAGLREGEVCQLRRDIDVDMEKRRIRVQPRTGEWEWRPKTDNSIRDLHMIDELYEILKQHIALGFAGERYLITIAKQDQPVSESWIIKRTKEAFGKAGLRYGMKGDGLTNHSLRHTFGSWMAQADVQIVKIAKLMGNTVEVCARHYVHMLPTDLDAAIEIVGKTAKQRQNASASANDTGNQGL